ncbi:succinate dehydrogenase, hydrophobic membrane anchor protein [Commensalibacter oyaizuii]|uniref:Succinate dehydrogenase hydrophobic membrane anchor subunit n=1 Tax=Commensalibacter oyaizuii TaxID=3043873 RepID=A0ABT6Q1U1_9PROT|nr:succinate dehydrogenase, hydrophobic membrane anchor protein [Commensalibacter sp. TBRC 16381]MDI2091065.1 succinate dehydrogenase, hydrophobic membrane anchor protein [Commensalibacter sp. TBRC 16381]
MRQLGAGHNIFEHWWTERVSAAGMAPLSIWFVIQMLRLADAEHQEVVDWTRKPVNSVLLLSLVILTFYHMRLGLQVISNDYSRGRNRLIINFCIKAGSLFMGLLAVTSILKLALAPSKK